MITIYLIFINDYVVALEYSKKEWEDSDTIDKNFYLGIL